MKIIKTGNFSEPYNREIYEKLKKMSGAKFSVGDFLEQFHDNGVRSKLTEIIIAESAGAPPEALFTDYLLKFRKFQFSDQLAKIRTEITKAEKEGDLQELEKLTREYRDLQNAVNRKVV